MAAEPLSSDLGGHAPIRPSVWRDAVVVGADDRDGIGGWAAQAALAETALRAWRRSCDALAVAIQRGRGVRARERVCAHLYTELAKAVQEERVARDLYLTRRFHSAGWVHERSRHGIPVRPPNDAMLPRMVEETSR